MHLADPGTAPVGGAALDQVIGLTAGAGIVTLILLYIAWQHRTHRIEWLQRLGEFAGRVLGTTTSFVATAVEVVLLLWLLLASGDLFYEKMMRLLPVAGTYFQLADYSELSDEGDLDFARRLTTEAGVTGIPVSPFYEKPPEQRIIRFCFAKNDATLEHAAARLCSLERL